MIRPVQCVLGRTNDHESASVAILDLWECIGRTLGFALANGSSEDLPAALTHCRGSSVPPNSRVHPSGAWLSTRCAHLTPNRWAGVLPYSRRLLTRVPPIVAITITQSRLNACHRQNFPYKNLLDDRTKARNVGPLADAVHWMLWLQPALLSTKSSPTSSFPSYTKMSPVRANISISISVSMNWECW